MAMRSNIVKITNELAEKGTLNFDLFETYNSILHYCEKNGTLHTPRKNNYALVDGCLFINGENIARVDDLPRRVSIDEIGAYYEGLILARNEVF